MLSFKSLVAFLYLTTGSLFVKAMKSVKLTSKRGDRKNKDEMLLIKFKSTHLLLNVDFFPFWDFTQSDSQIIPKSDNAGNS